MFFFVLQTHNCHKRYWHPEARVRRLINVDTLGYNCSILNTNKYKSKHILVCLFNCLFVDSFILLLSCLLGYANFRFKRHWLLHELITFVSLAWASQCAHLYVSSDNPQRPPNAFCRGPPPLHLSLKQHCTPCAFHHVLISPPPMSMYSTKCYSCCGIRLFRSRTSKYHQHIISVLFHWQNPSDLIRFVYPGFF